ncbi:16S rRNA (cytosine(1402)-N(4))-methyltransferase RsmH [Salinisphaera sp. USBA-960]|uniref:16S rRNA (cytosine(1402)-N(4))-methyltransferase RsmH n=1 Tax=Salinisphaera orenii TaxID=856731 RepID=UPI000DBE812B|nr:16S rRNA (cytosine(1402)-N(4))-methyltransferase RsmH [Salifodinibacter halophilus]NNC26766.1 16S rRNA (cytosine(1402)-N(4))-methyltransferase RsmH [Salifodinibacter halophilus]
MTDCPADPKPANSDAGHAPVLVREAVTALAPERGGVFVDATFGRGGHTRALLDAAPADARVIALDQDPDAARAAEVYAQSESRLRFESANFADLTEVIANHAPARGVDGILFDLGVSSPQLTSAERGFSLRYPGPLDMRMNPALGQSLADWLDRVDSATLAAVIRRYGDEAQARRIADTVVAKRAAGRINDSGELAAAVAEAVPAPVARGRATHPATKTFNALRVFINDELGALQRGLDAAVRALAVDGRLAVISFQSQEDRIVKRALRHQADPPQPPVPMADRTLPALELIGKPIAPDANEVSANPRARSAIMRSARRTQHAVVES